MTGPDAAGKRLRDLTEQEFHAVYGTDRFTASVLSSRRRYIVDHMAADLMNNAFSLILRDWYDFVATISGPPEMNYPMPTIGSSLMLFSGTMAEAVRNTIEEFGPDNVRPGDVIIANDPYRQGTHVNDVCFIRPVFAQDRLVSFIALRAHQLDMGGIVPAGFSGTKRDVYENGLVIPPVLLYREDKPVPSTFHFIFDNARFCNLLLPDIKTIYQSLLLGERLLTESIERYGVEAYLGSMTYSCDVSADSMREAIRTKIPDGVYTAVEHVDADGLDDTRQYRVQLTVTKRGEHLEVDLSGTSEQARTCINGTVLDAKTAIGMSLKMLIENDTPFTSGVFRTIDVVIPAGTILSATPPDGAVFLFWESSMPLLTAMYRALSDALGPEAVGGDYGSLMIHNGNGVLADGTPWVTTAQCGGEHGPWGGSRDADGDSYTVEHMLNNIDPATEAIEADVPVVLLRKEYTADTAGPGHNRGGAAVLKDTLWLSDAEHWSMPLHTKSPTGVGVYGGRDGTTQANWVFPPDVFDVVGEGDLLPLDDDVYRRSTPVAGLLDPVTKRVSTTGEYHYFASTPIWRTTPRTVFRYLTGGGGGWGDPLSRDPARVLRDVRDEYVTVEAAVRDYGVVVVGDPHSDPEGLVLDSEATERRRAELRGV